MQLERGNTHTDDSGQDKAPEESLEVIKLNSTVITRKTRKYFIIIRRLYNLILQIYDYWNGPSHAVSRFVLPLLCV